MNNSKHFQITLFYGINKIVRTEIMMVNTIKEARLRYLKKYPSIAKKIKENSKYWIGFKRIR